jgi:nitrosocyanin
MNKFVPIVLIVLVLGVGGYYVMKRGSNGSNSYTMTPTVATTPAVTGSTGADSSMGAVKEFDVEGGMYYFKPNVITVKKGDTVKIVFTNKEGMHDWVIDEFNARTKKIKEGETDTVTFVADTVGTFEYYCSVGSHRAMGMKGSLIVQ